MSKEEIEALMNGLNDKENSEEEIEKLVLDSIEVVDDIEIIEDDNDLSDIDQLLEMFDKEDNNEKTITKYEKSKIKTKHPIEKEKYKGLLTNIIIDEIELTLESLLAKKINITNIYDKNNISINEENFIKTKVEVIVRNGDTDKVYNIDFYTTNNTATIFEYTLLGEMCPLKNKIDSEVIDATNEIVSNIFGSIATSVNAQGFRKIKNLLSEVSGSKIIKGKEKIKVEKKKLDLPLLFEIDIPIKNLPNEKRYIMINFDDDFLNNYVLTESKEINIKKNEKKYKNIISEKSGELIKVLINNLIEKKESNITITNENKKLFKKAVKTFLHTL